MMHQVLLRIKSFCMVPPRSHPPSLLQFRRCAQFGGAFWNSKSNSPHYLTKVVPPSTSTSLPFILRNFSSPLSPFDPKNVKASGDTSSEIVFTKTKKRRRTFIPRIAAVQLTEKARVFFKQLLENPVRSDIIGIMLNYDQSKSGEPRMVYSFQFVTNSDIDPEQDEGVSLEMIPSIDPSTHEATLIPKPPVDSRNDGTTEIIHTSPCLLKSTGFDNRRRH